MPNGIVKIIRARAVIENGGVHRICSHLVLDRQMLGAQKFVVLPLNKLMQVTDSQDRPEGGIGSRV